MHSPPFGPPRAACAECSGSSSPSSTLSASRIAASPATPAASHCSRTSRRIGTRVSSRSVPAPPRCMHQVAALCRDGKRHAQTQLLLVQSFVSTVFPRCCTLLFPPSRHVSRGGAEQSDDPRTAPARPPPTGTARMSSDIKASMRHQM
jgi:hypothetical protein